MMTASGNDLLDDEMLNDLTLSNPISTTDRNVFTKLELIGDAKSQVEAVQRRIYNLDFSLLQPAANNLHWATTDDILYSEAKRSYENITNAFLKSPRVYKLEAMGKRHQEKHSAELLLSQSLAALPSIQPSPKRKRKNRNKFELEELPPTDLAQTFINPFVEGNYDQVWKEKLQLLEKLTPREDLDGYEYRETYDEQQYRQSLERDFQERLQVKMGRRIEQPTDDEQVEDVIYEMIECLCGHFSAIDKQHRLEIHMRRQRLDNPATLGYKKKSLMKLETPEGVVTQVVTDKEFIDVLVSKAGWVIPRTVPGQVVAQHRQEKRLLQALQRKLDEEREEERRRPLTSKLRSAVVMARQDLSGSVRQLLRDVLDTTLVLPTRPLREKCSQFINQGSQRLISLAKDPQAAYYIILYRLYIILYYIILYISFYII
jgi:hypothetical protein